MLKKLVRDKTGAGWKNSIFFIFNGEGYIKAYQEQMPETDELESFTDSSGAVHLQPVMVSYNRKYEPRVIHPMDEFQVIGRVLK